MQCACASTEPRCGSILAPYGAATGDSRKAAGGDRRRQTWKPMARNTQTGYDPRCDGGSALGEMAVRDIGGAAGRFDGAGWFEVR